MKKNMIISLCIFLFFCVSAISVQAYKIDIVSKNSELTDTTNQGSQTASFYTILITVKNNGTDYSDDITIELVDDMGIPTQKNYTFSPSEIKTFQFKDYPIVGAGQHEITINYYPSNQSRTDQGNSGSTTMIVGESSNQTSTPFLPVGFLISLILIITIIRKKQIVK